MATKMLESCHRIKIATVAIRAAVRLEPDLSGVIHNYYASQFPDGEDVDVWCDYFEEIRPAVESVAKKIRYQVIVDEATAIASETNR